MLNDLSMRVTNLLTKASPLANEYTGFLKRVSKMIASKKELGWLAASNSGPFCFNNLLLLILILLQYKWMKHRAGNKKIL